MIQHSYTSPKLVVAVDDPSYGWAVTQVSFGSQFIRIDASYIYDTFSELTCALRKLLIYPNHAEVVYWQTEPIEYKMHFVVDTERFQLSICRDRENRVLYAEGTFKEIILPFWRMLRGLQGRFSEQEWQEHWGHNFPKQALERLTQEVKIYRERELNHR